MSRIQSPKTLRNSALATLLLMSSVTAIGIWNQSQMPLNPSPSPSPEASAETSARLSQTEIDAAIAELPSALRLDIAPSPTSVALELNLNPEPTPSSVLPPAPGSTPDPDAALLQASSPSPTPSAELLTLNLASGQIWEGSPPEERIVVLKAMMSRIFAHDLRQATSERIVELDACIRASAQEKDLKHLKVYELGAACAMALGWIQVPSDSPAPTGSPG